MIAEHRTKILGILALIFVVALVSPVTVQSMQIAKTEPWEIYAADAYENPGESISNIRNTIKADFNAQGWTITKYVQCGERGFAADSFNQFAASPNPAICVITAQQTPVYAGPNPYYWAAFIFDANGKPGTMNGDGERVFGNNGKSWDNTEVSLVRYVIHNNRAVIIIWTGDRHDTGNLKSQVYAWQWVAKNPNAQQQWYIFNDAGSIIDKSLETIHFITVDNTPPTVSITAPKNVEKPAGPADTIDGTITVSGKASDSLSGVQKMEINVDGGDWIECFGTTSWSVSLDTTAYTDGSHVITACATDGASNTAETTVMVWIWNDKTVTIYDWNAPQIDPQIPSYVSGIAKIKARVTDDYGLDAVYISIDDSAWQKMTYDAANEIYYFEWDTRQVVEGKHTIRIKAEDLNGNIALSIIHTSKLGADTSAPLNIRNLVLIVSGVGIALIVIPMLLRELEIWD